MPVRLVELARDTSHDWPLDSLVSLLISTPARRSQSLSVRPRADTGSSFLEPRLCPPGDVAPDLGVLPCGPMWTADLLFGRGARGVAEPWREWCRVLEPARRGERLSREGVVGRDLPWIYEVE
jgi:hypothetical protein